MFSISNAYLIARREYLERVRAKSFIVMTILIPALMGAAAFGLILMNKTQKPAKHLAVLTADPTFA
ncbi:MAG: ABC transporter permease, partial [Bryocella sp.]